MFKRTPNGLSNEHLFYGVQFTVYCEGKIQDPDVSTFDELFWTVILKQAGASFIVKSVGDKSSVLELLNDIQNNNVKNVLLCADADYDDVFQKKIDHPCLIHSYGYSWESDAIVFMNFFSAINLFINCANESIHQYEFEKFTKKFEKTLRRACIIDIRYFNAPSALFDREKPQSILINDIAKAPKLNVKKLLQSASNISYRESANLRYPNNPWSSFFGKTVAKIVYHWFANRFSKEKLARKVSYDIFMGHLSSSCSLNDNELSEYYSPKINRFLEHNAR